MINLRDYCVGIKPKDSTVMMLTEIAEKKTDEALYVLLIPKSIVDELKKGVIGEWK